MPAETISQSDFDHANTELARRMEEEKYHFYEPSGKGEEFIDMVGSGEKFITLYSAANGVGKTATAVNILAHIFWHTGENPFFELPLMEKWPFMKRLRIVSSPTNIEKNIIPQMEFWFPQGRYEHTKGNKKFFSQWKTDTGWEIDIMTYEQSPVEFEGPTFGLIWFDEPPPEAIFKANISRLRMGGTMFITGTPLAGSAYLYDAFARGEITVDVTLPDGTVTKYVRRVGYIEADVESACKEHGIRGHLEHDAIMSMIAEYTEEEKQARIYGKFQHLIGRIFKMFNPKVHVITPFPINKKDFCVVEYIDPHPRNPDAVLWLAIDRFNQKYVVNELWIKPRDIDELAERIRDKGESYRILYRKGDQSMFNVNQHDSDGKSLGDRLADRNLTYQPASKKREAADRRIGDALSYTEINGHMLRAPEIYIFDTCKVTIKEIEGYRWDEHTGAGSDKHGPKEKPIDKDDHMVENLGRALLDEPQYRPVERHVNTRRGIDFDSYGAGTPKHNDDPYA